MPHLSETSPRVRPLVAMLIALAVASAAAGGDLLARHYLGPRREYQAISGWLLAVLAIVQIGLAWLAWRDRLPMPPTVWLRSRWPLLFAGPVVCYLLVAAAGSDRYVRYLFRPALAGWYTAILAAVVLPGVMDHRWMALFRRREMRIAANALCIVLIVGASAELLLRVAAGLRGEQAHISLAVESCRLPPGKQIGGRTVNSLGYLDDEFLATRSTAVLRVAVLGDEAVLVSTAGDDFLTQLERRWPKLDLLNFAVPGTGPREYVATVRRDVMRFDPDLVLAVISIGDDVTTRLSLPGGFDWRTLQLARVGRSWLGDAANAKPNDDLASTAATDREAYLRQAAQRLMVCRTPQDDRLHRRWRDTYDHLTELWQTCRRHNVRLALVLAPSEGQLDPRLRQTLCNRLGWSGDEVDVSLPQRRITAFAREREIAVIDLLPHLRRQGETPFAANGHAWNGRGNRVAAEAIGGWLKAQFPGHLEPAAIATRPIQTRTR